jgi:hypothetical protein
MVMDISLSKITTIPAIVLASAWVYSIKGNMGDALVFLICAYFGYFFLSILMDTYYRSVETGD